MSSILSIILTHCLPDCCVRVFNGAPGRYVLSTMRSEADLQEVLWVCGTVNRLHKAGAGGSSAESEQLVGLGALIAMLQSVDDPRAEAAMRRARAHGAMPPLDPSDLAHMIDLLRLTGADRISAAVRLRIDTLRLGAGDDDERNKSRKLKRMLTSVRKEVRPPHATPCLHQIAIAEC